MFALFCRVSRRQQGVDGNLRLRHIGDERVAIAKGEAPGLDLQMQAFGRQRIEPAEIEARQDVQHDERGDALVVRRNLADVEAAIVGRDRRHIVGLVVGQILQAVQRTELPQIGDDVFGYRAAIEAVAALLADLAQRRPELRIADHFARLRRSPLRQEDAGGVGIAPEPFSIQVPLPS